MGNDGGQRLRYNDAVVRKAKKPEPKFLAPIVGVSIISVRPFEFPERPTARHSQGAEWQAP